MNILVTGANGQLGNEMRLLAGGQQDRYVFTDVTPAEGVSYLDITDLEAVRRLVAGEGIDVIVNCAAYTDVEAAESNEPLAGKLNADAPGNLAAAMREAGGLLVQISTDYVFGKEPYNVPCTENRQGTPTGVYGLTKLHGEQKVAASGCKYVIIRTSWLYSEFGKNFCRTMMALTSSRPMVNVVYDQVGTPTYALDLAEAVLKVIKDYGQYSGCAHYPKSGIYHFSNEGVCSWYDFAKMIAEYCGNTGCEVLPCLSKDYPSRVKRPSYSVLDKSKIKAVFGIDTKYWTDSLRRCINNIRTAGER